MFERWVHVINSIARVKKRRMEAFRLKRMHATTKATNAAKELIDTI